MSRVIDGYRSSSPNFFADSPTTKRRSACSSAMSTGPGALDLVAESCPPKPIIWSRDQMSTASARSGYFAGRNDRPGITHSNAPLRSNRSRPRLVCDRRFQIVRVICRARGGEPASVGPRNFVDSECANDLFDEIDIALQIPPMTRNFPFHHLSGAGLLQTEPGQNLIDCSWLDRDPDDSIAFFIAQ